MIEPTNTFHIRRVLIAVIWSMAEAEVLTKVRSHTAIFSKLAGDFEEQINATRAAETGVSRAIRSKTVKFF